MKYIYAIIINGQTRTCRQRKCEALAYAHSMKECHPNWEVSVKREGETILTI